MDTDKERKKTKGRRVLKRKGKKLKHECVEEVTRLVKDLKVETLDSSLGPPEITVEETKSQPLLCQPCKWRIGKKKKSRVVRVIGEEVPLQIEEV